MSRHLWKDNVNIYEIIRMFFRADNQYDEFFNSSDDEIIKQNLFDFIKAEDDEKILLIYNFIKGNINFK